MTFHLAQAAIISRESCIFNKIRKADKVQSVLTFSLKAKLLTLVAIPLLVEVGLILAIVNLNQQAEEESRTLHRAQQVMSCLNRLYAESYNVWFSVYSGTDRRELMSIWINQPYQESIHRLLRTYDDMDKVIWQDAKIKQSIATARAGMHEALDIFAQAREEIRQGRVADVYNSRVDLKKRLNTIYSTILNEQIGIAAAQASKIAEASPLRQAQIRKQQLNIISAAAIFNSALGLLLAVFIVRRITARLSIMSDNVQRFANRAPLHKQLGGNDEIAELDKNFHEMARIVEEASRVRQETTSMITHDLRSPLGVIQGCTEILEERHQGDMNENVLRLNKSISTNSKRLINLVDDLLDTQKMAEGDGTLQLHTEAVSLETIYKELDLNITDWVKQVGLSLVIEPCDAVVMVDVSKVNRIFFNLISNAIKFSPRGGSISIRTKPASKNTDKRFIEIIVRDQGPGIAPESLSLVFERFKQLDSRENRTTSSSGLGLSICRAFVEMHGGKIWAESAPGQGAAFHFTLPLL